jgi:hypothetical protein
MLISVFFYQVQYIVVKKIDQKRLIIDIGVAQFHAIFLPIFYKKLTSCLLLHAF